MLPRSICRRCYPSAARLTHARSLSTSIVLEKGGPRTVQRKPLTSRRPSTTTPSPWKQSEGKYPQAEGRNTGGKFQARGKPFEAVGRRDERPAAGARGERTGDRGVPERSVRYPARDTRTPIEPTTSRRLARDLTPPSTPSTRLHKGGPEKRQPPAKLDPSFPPNLQPTPSTFIARSLPSEPIPKSAFPNTPSIPGSRKA